MNFSEIQLNSQSLANGFLSNSKTSSVTADNENGFAALFQEMMNAQGKNTQAFSSQQTGKSKSQPELRWNSGLAGKKNLTMVKNDHDTGNRSSLKIDKTPLPKKSGLYALQDSSRDENADEIAEPSTTDDESSESLKQATALVEKILAAREELGTDDPAKILAALSANSEKASQPVVLEPSASFDPSGDQDLETSAKAILEALKADPKTGPFWQSVDEKSALQVIMRFLQQSMGSVSATTITGQTEDEGSQESAENSSLESGKRTTKKERNSKEQQSGEIDAEGAETDGIDPEESGTRSSSESSISTEAKQQGLIYREKKTREDSPETDLAEQETNQKPGSHLSSSQDAGLTDTARLVPIQGEAGRVHQVQGEGKPVLSDKVILQAQTEFAKMSKNQFQGGNQSEMGQGFQGNAASQVREGLRQTNSPETVRAVIFSQLVEKASLLKGPQEVKALTIQLKPEHLGKVNLELISKDGAVTGRILADNPEVRARMEELVPQIKDHLAELGISLSQLSVDVSSQNPDGRNSDSLRDQLFGGLRVRANRSAFQGIGHEDESSGPIITGNIAAEGIDITV